MLLVHQAALSTAEGLAREHIAKFNGSGDKRSEAVLLLAAGEINYNKRGPVQKLPRLMVIKGQLCFCLDSVPGGKKRAEAFEDLKKARSLAKEAGDKKVGLDNSQCIH